MIALAANPELLSCDGMAAEAFGQRKRMPDWKRRWEAALAVCRLDRAELEALSTRELLVCLQTLRSCEESLEGSDLSAEEAQDASDIPFRNTEKWQRAFQDVKDVLSTREHVPRSNKAERKQQRVLRAKRNRTSEKSRRR